MQQPRIQPNVPDLILGRPQGQVPTAQPETAQTTAPYQAPAQAQIQQTMQNMTAALMEMGMPPTPQNVQMAQLLASYGHAVNQQTLGIFQQALRGLPDKSPATMEAVMILLTQELPVNEKTVAAIKQFMNGQPLPQQLQALPKDLGGLLQQMQQTAQLPQAGQTAQTPSQVASQPGQQAVQQATSPQVAGQQVAQQIQSGQVVTQLAPQSAVVQQAAGQTQAVEHREDGLSKIADKTTAQKVDLNSQTAAQIKAVEQLEDGEGKSPQSQLVNQHLPSAQNRDQQSLQQLYLYLQGQEPVQAVGREGAQSVLSPQETVLQLLKVLQDLSQIAGHLGENMQLKDFGQLFPQHQQIIQLTGLLEAKLQEFERLFAQAFPELSKNLPQLLSKDGQDMFGKLAQLLEDNQQLLQERLRLPGQADEQGQLLSSLRQLMEQVGFQVEKIQSHLVAREMLSQNLPVHVVPIMVHANGESYPAEIYVHQDADGRDPENRHEGDERTRLTLTLETKNMGRVAIDLTSRKDDMGLDLKVITRRIKLAFDERLDELKHRVERNGEYKVEHLSCRVVPDLESRQSMLLPPKRPIRSLRRVEGVV